MGRGSKGRSNGGQRRTFCAPCGKVIKGTPDRIQKAIDLHYKACETCRSLPKFDSNSVPFDNDANPTDLKGGRGYSEEHPANMKAKDVNGAVCDFEVAGDIHTKKFWAERKERNGLTQEVQDSVEAKIKELQEVGSDEESLILSLGNDMMNKDKKIAELTSTLTKVVVKAQEYEKKIEELKEEIEDRVSQHDAEHKEDLAFLEEANDNINHQDDELKELRWETLDKDKKLAEKDKKIASLMEKMENYKLRRGIWEKQYETDSELIIKTAITLFGEKPNGNPPCMMVGSILDRVKHLVSDEYKHEVLRDNIDDAMGNWVDDLFGTTELEDVKKRMDKLEEENTNLRLDVDAEKESHIAYVKESKVGLVKLFEENKEVKDELARLLTDYLPPIHVDGKHPFGSYGSFKKRYLDQYELLRKANVEINKLMMEKKAVGMCAYESEDSEEWNMD